MASPAAERPSVAPVSDAPPPPPPPLAVAPGSGAASDRPLPSEAQTTAAAPAARPRARRARLVFPVLALLFAGGGLLAWRLGAGRESTDDAFVEAHVANVAARIQGQVARVRVRDNQEVAEGEVLVELDDRDARVRVAAARADLESAQASLEAAQAQLTLVEHTVDATVKQARGGIKQASSVSSSTSANITQARADVEAAEARLRLAESELRRTEKLASEGALAVAELDVKRANYDQAQASLAQARARYSSAQAGLDNATGGEWSAQGRLQAALTGPAQVEAARAQVGVARARVAQAQAALDQAELTLGYTVVRAPQHGLVSRRTVEPGQSVDPARPLLSITGTDDVWVVANFKEDQLGSMRAQQKARVTIDTYPGRPFAAHVDSIAGGTGSRFALLPPDNASGNFTKVVQRVPVLLRFDQPPGVPLRPGMSAYAVVTTHD